jgi:hypothetical protein
VKDKDKQKQGTASFLVAKDYTIDILSREKDKDR